MEIDKNTTAVHYAYMLKL